MPRTSTVRPARADHASTAVCRVTCSNGGSAPQHAPQRVLARPPGLRKIAHQRRNLIAFPGAGGRRMDPVQETAERRCELAGLMVWRLIGHGLDLQLRWPLPAARDTQPSVSIGPPRD